MDQNFAQLAVPRLWALEDEVVAAWHAALGRARVLQSIDTDRQLRQEWRFLVSRMAAGRLGNDEEIRARGGWHTGGLGCDVAAVRLGFAAIRDVTLNALANDASLTVAQRLELVRSCAAFLHDYAMLYAEGATHARPQQRLVARSIGG